MFHTGTLFSQLLFLCIFNNAGKFGLGHLENGPWVRFMFRQFVGEGRKERDQAEDLAGCTTITSRSQRRNREFLVWDGLSEQEGIDSSCWQLDHGEQTLLCRGHVPSKGQLRALNHSHVQQLGKSVLYSWRQKCLLSTTFGVCMKICIRSCGNERALVTFSHADFPSPA